MNGTHFSSPIPNVLSNINRTNIESLCDLTDMRDPCQVPSTKQLKPNMDRRLKFRCEVTISFMSEKNMEYLDSLVVQVSCRLASKRSYHYLPSHARFLNYYQFLVA